MVSEIILVWDQSVRLKDPERSEGISLTNIFSRALGKEKKKILFLMQRGDQSFSFFGTEILDIDERDWVQK